VKKTSATSDCKVYDLLKPHCIIAEPYRDIHGNKRWRCSHQDNNDFDWRDEDETGIG
jgi:hypothetical protein